MKILNLLATGMAGGIETLCNNIDKYSNEDNYWVFLFLKGEIADKMIKRNPSKVFYLGYNKMRFFKYVDFLNKMIKEKNIEVVSIHHGGTYCNVLFYILKKLNKDVKFVRFLHSCYEDEFSLKHKFFEDILYLRYLNKALQCSDMIISVSNAVQESYEKKFNLKNKKKKVIYNGIGNEFYEKKQQTRKHMNNRPLELIYVGRLVGVKGVDILIKAVSVLCKKKYSAKLTIVGDGKERQKYKELVENLNLQEKVSFVGVQTNVIKWLDKSDLFVYPSICKEAFGISVVEAMARGCVPIVSNRGGLTEIVEDGKTGYIFKNKDIMDLVNKILQYISLKDKDEISNRSIEKSKTFRINNTIDSINEAYKEIVEK